MGRDTFELKIPSAIGMTEKDTEEEEVTAQHHSHVTVCDINQAMLNVGKKRASEKGLISGNYLNPLLIPVM